ncbi:hypothetical protein [Sphingobium sp. SCG-1]|uniref:hypothetical protein n=1 Tax=Sphingobium sp. SCG-1 TaxID=2072936 RepID=UPI00166FAC06|nr:hypothetical protein [Sphingobium sp. SCG-1]
MDEDQRMGRVIMVGLKNPFALSLSKGSAEPRAKHTSFRSVEGFDELSPNGIESAAL